MLRQFIFNILLITLIKAKQNAVIFILCRNSDLSDISKTIVNFEEKFNKKHKYPYLYLNDKDFTEEFKNEILKVTNDIGKGVDGSNEGERDVTFGKIDPKDWLPPAEIDIVKAKKNWIKMANKGVPYAMDESYHNMCRFYSRAFYKHPLVQEYEYYWRVEPGVKFHCDIVEDPFDEMYFKNKKYGFVITIREFMDSVTTLMSETRKFLKNNYNLIPKYNNNKFLLENGDFNGCHFWSNFEIASFDFFRSEYYNKYVDHLEKSGVFYYERVGDAPVHSIAATLFLDKSQIMFFDKIGYTHDSFTHCPKTGVNCDCDVSKGIAYTPFSCLDKYLANL